MRRLFAALAALLVLVSGVQALPGRPQGFGGGRPGFRFLSASPAACVLWTPQNNLTSALVAQWDARQGVAATAATVTSWTDIVGGIVASPVTGQPSPTTTTRNGIPAIAFNPSQGSQILQFTPSAGFPTSKAAGAIFVAMYSQQGTGTGQAFNFGNHSGGIRGTATRGGVVSVGTLGSDFNSTFSTVSKDTAFLWQQSSGVASIYADGSAAQTGSLNVDNDITTGVFGGQPPTGNYGEGFNGYLQQALVFNRVLTDNEWTFLAGWESWADGKMGSNLPTSHRFATRAPCTTD